MGNPHEKPKQPPIFDENTSRALFFLDRAKCDRVSPKNTTDKGLCALAKARNFGEMARLSRFTEEFGKKFLSKLGEEKFKTKDPYKLLKAIQKDEIWKHKWKDIMRRFKKAKSYEVKARKGDDPAMIIFKYANGKTEKYPLELSFRKSLFLGKAIAGSLRKMLAQKEQDEKGPQAVDNLAKEIDYDKIQQNANKHDNEIRKLINRCKTLKTPKAAYEKMLNSSHYLNEDLLRELSGPMSKVAAMWSKGEAGGDKFELMGEKASQVLEKYYPGFSKNGLGAMATKEERNDLMKIAETFGIE